MSCRSKAHQSASARAQAHTRRASVTTRDAARCATAAPAAPAVRMVSEHDSRLHSSTSSFARWFSSSFSLNSPLDKSCAALLFAAQILQRARRFACSSRRVDLCARVSTSGADRRRPPTRHRGRSSSQPLHRRRRLTTPPVACRRRRTTSRCPTTTNAKRSSSSTRRQSKSLAIALARFRLLLDCRLLSVLLFFLLAPQLFSWAIKRLVFLVFFCSI